MHHVFWSSRNPGDKQLFSQCWWQTSLGHPKHKWLLVSFEKKLFHCCEWNQALSGKVLVLQKKEPNKTQNKITSNLEELKEKKQKFSSPLGHKLPFLDISNPKKPFLSAAVSSGLSKTTCTCSLAFFLGRNPSIWPIGGGKPHAAIY